MESLFTRFRHVDRLLVLLVPWVLSIWAGTYLLVHQQLNVTGQTSYVLQELPVLPGYALFLRYPTVRQSLIAGPGGRAEVRFHWELRAEDKTWSARHSRLALLLEVSPRADFPPELTETTRLPSAANTSLTEWLAPGRYFWRMSFASSTKSETREFRVDPSAGRRLSGESDGE